MNDFLVSELPAIDSVEILRFELVKGQESWVPHAFASGEVAQEIARLFRDLPFSGQMRCHTPPFSLRFRHDGNLVLQCSLCWQCNNIWIVQNGEQFVYEFDGEAPVSQQLLQLLQSHFSPSAA